MTLREKLVESIRVRNAALMAIPAIAARVFPVGSAVEILSRKVIVVGTVRRVGIAGEVIVSLTDGVREVLLSDLPDWNPHAGETLAELV